MSSFSWFTRKYSLSKTLRFELKPIGMTLENMRNQTYKEKKNFDSDLQTFLHDQDIEDAYQTLKPILDSLHEEFINTSLGSSAANKIDFSEYLVAYRERGNDSKEGEKTTLSTIENTLRKEIGKTYLEWAKGFIEQAKKINTNTKEEIDGEREEEKEEEEDKKKEKWLFKKKNFELLTEPGILIFIENRLDSMDFEEQKKWDIKNALKVFKWFFTYFSGYNINRENYYAIDKEKSTAVASRIVHENLPKFCDNIISFEKKKDEYFGIYTFLKSRNINLQIKDAESAELVTLYDITEDIFDITFFSSCLSQSGIENYNRIIGHYNALINLYNQARKKDEKFTRLTWFKELYKQIWCGKKWNWIKTITHDTDEQILSDRNHTWDAISVEHILELARRGGNSYFNHWNENDIAIKTIPDFLDWLNHRTDWSGIYWSKSAINSISNIYFPNWESIKQAMKDDKTLVSYDKKREEQIKIHEAVELSGLFQVLDSIDDANWKETLFKKTILEDEEKKQIIQKAISPSRALIALIGNFIEKNMKDFLIQSDSIKKLQEYNSPESKEAIKSWMDWALSVNQAIRYFHVRESKTKGETLNSELVNILKNLLDVEDARWFEWYDLLRNYLTKKPQDDAKENKLKLNFENSTLAAGWDINKEKDNTCVILQDPEWKTYLAIMTQDKKTVFQKELSEWKGKNKTTNLNPLYEIDGVGSWKKMEYKLLPGPNKMLPKCLMPWKERGKYGATKEILDIYDRGSFKKWENTFTIVDLHKMIDFYKDGLRRYTDWQVFDFQFRPTNEYEDISQFYADVEKQWYKLSFQDINKTVLDTLVKNGDIYLFEIKNQDSNAGKWQNHKNNLHTIYWKAIFEQIENRPKLNGQAEIFYLKPLSPKKLKKKIDTNWNKILNKNGQEIIDGYRFSRERFVFHCPITLNFCLDTKWFNQDINTQLSSDWDVYFLGLDRGEKHLVYYSIVDKNGIMIPGGQGSFNEINWKNYHTLLSEREWERMESRKNWQTIGNISKLKEWYISLVIHEIIEKLQLHNWYIVLEDLNTGFKRWRQKIEKSIYQKFELALAKKLNFVVDKSAELGEIGSVTNALQLTPPVSNYGEIENQKQVGIMLYTRANYTSQTDPATGWRKTIYLKTWSEERIKEQIVTHFSDIGYDGQDYYFEYRDKIGKTWILYSWKKGKSLTRFRGIRGKEKNVWKIEEINIPKMLDEIFSWFDKNRSFLSQILDEGMEIKKIDEHTAWESLRFTIDLIQQIRNSGDKNRREDDNFLLSPVRDEYGNHFDTREQKEWLPKDADANGAYNIARKGIIMSEYIRANTDPKDIDLFVSDEEWDLWLTDREEWMKKLPIYSSKKAMKKYRSDKANKS